jgi:uridine kinase
VRDARDRGHAVRDTIRMWDKVRDGENRNIFPYQENADTMFNSALVYEQGALKLLAEPLLAALDWFLPVPTEFIPENSILREFIGSSSLKDFKLWAEA